jgi:hypothetical protein
MNSTTFSLLANYNAEVDGNQEMDLTIGSLNFRIGPSGSTRLSDPAKLDPSANETKTIAMTGSSVGSSSEVNSPVSFTTAENTGEKIEELDEIMENLDIGGTMDQSYTNQKDFITRSGGVSSNIQQLCVIITEAAEEKRPCRQCSNPRASQQIKEQQQKGERENSRLYRRVENYHVSYQSRYESTRQLKERSSDGVSVCPTSTQKEVAGEKRRVQKKSGKQ